MFKRGEVTHW